MDIAVFGDGGVGFRHHKYSMCRAVNGRTSEPVESTDTWPEDLRENIEMTGCYKRGEEIGKTTAKRFSSILIDDRQL